MIIYQISITILLTLSAACSSIFPVIPQIHLPTILTATIPETRYNFMYSVDDQETGDIKSQSEIKENGEVHGRYSFIQPDGMRRTVEYKADNINGFMANVKTDMELGMSTRMKAIEDARVMQNMMKTKMHMMDQENMKQDKMMMMMNRMNMETMGNVEYNKDFTTGDHNAGEEDKTDIQKNKINLTKIDTNENRNIRNDMITEDQIKSNQMGTVVTEDENIMSDMKNKNLANNFSIENIKTVMERTHDMKSMDNPMDKVFMAINKHETIGNPYILQRIRNNDRTDDQKVIIDSVRTMEEPKSTQMIKIEKGFQTKLIPATLVTSVDTSGIMTNIPIYASDVPRLSNIINE